MLRQLLVSVAVSLCNIAIHAIVMAAVLRVARVASDRTTSYQTLRLIVVMTATVSVLMAAHIAEVAAWSFAYAIVAAAPPGTDLIYFAFVNYTTLGYGDVTSVAALVPARTDDGDERRPIIWLVDRRHFCGPAKSFNGKSDRSSAKDHQVVMVRLATAQVTPGCATCKQSQYF